MSAIDGLLDDAATCKNCYIDERAARAELAAMREELKIFSEYFDSLRTTRAQATCLFGHQEIVFYPSTDAPGCPLCAMREELADWRDSAKRAAGEDCAPDEKHCTCVGPMREVIAMADELANDVSCVVDRNQNKYDCEVDYKDIEAMRDGRNAYRAARESVK